MKKNRFLKFLKKMHKWPAIFIAVFAILFAISGIVMNHRQTFSSIDVSRKVLPDNYEYKNWNTAAVRGSVKISDNDYLLFGNIGIWKTGAGFDSFTDYNQGFPKGIDNRKIYAVTQLNNQLFAGTYFGLFKRNVSGGAWQKIELPVKNERITDLGIKGDTLLVLTRDYLLKGFRGAGFDLIQVPEPVGYVPKTGMFNTLWELHSGEMFGLPGKLLVDLLGLVTIFLAVTGLLHFFLPKYIKKRKVNQKEVKKLASTKKKNLSWHNIVGAVFAILLIINTFSGMHLRPPLLIAIANSEVGIIPGTHMDTPNAWQDKLRRIYWDDIFQRYMFYTSEGFYFADEELTEKLQPVPSQPQVSVMGCNVFKPLGEQKYLVGSFSGLFLWDMKTGVVYDYFTKKVHVAPKSLSRPISDHMVTGMVETGKGAFWFDYNRGVMPLNGFGNLQTSGFAPMPAEIIKKSPISLWNVSLELHTGRIFQNVLGPFYILYVPLAGICILLVLFSGFLMWWKIRVKKKKKKKEKKRNSTH
jgi:hypothetical protein